MNVDYNDIDNKPDVSDSSFTKSVGSSSNIRWDNAYIQYRGTLYGMLNMNS